MRLIHFQMNCRVVTLLIALLSGTMLHVAYGQSSQATDGLDNDQSQMVELTDILKFSEDFCGEYWRQGSQTDLSGQAELALDDFLASILPIDGQADLKISRYSGVLREHLAGELRSVRECRETLWNDLKDLRDFSHKRVRFTPEQIRNNEGAFNCDSLVKQIERILVLGERSRTAKEIVNKIVDKDIGCAEKIATRIRDVDIRDETLERVVKAYVELGQCNYASGAAEKMRSVSRRSAQFRKISIAMVVGSCYQS